MSTLEKTIDLLHDLPENQIETIYSFVRFLSSQQTAEKTAGTKSLDDILKNVVSAVPDTWKLPEDYREDSECFSECRPGRLQPANQNYKNSKKGRERSPDLFFLRQQQSFIVVVRNRDFSLICTLCLRFFKFLLSWCIMKQIASVLLSMRSKCVLNALPLKKTHLERIENALIFIIPGYASLSFQSQYSFRPHFIQSSSRLLSRKPTQLPDFFVRYKFC